MNVLLYGDGNVRDHAAFVRLKLERIGEGRFYGLKPNALLASEPGVTKVANISEAVVAARSATGLVTILDPVHLLAGGVDQFRSAGLNVLGPDAAAAELEGSKLLGKKICNTAIPAPNAQFFADLPSLLCGLKNGWNDDSKRFVLKSDRFLRNAHFRCMVPESLAEALAMARRQWEIIQLEVGGGVLLEERIDGEELSLHIMFDGDSYILFPPVKDYKRARDYDQGPNTHGMAAIAVGSQFGYGWDKRLRREIVEPSLAAIQDAGLSYRGFLYIGIMLTTDGPQILEFNVRPGNPEFAVLLPLLQSSFYEMLIACVSKRLYKYPVSWNVNDISAGVFAVASGYPTSESYSTATIRGAEAAYGNRSILGEGIGREGKHLCVTGGRVLLALGYGSTLAEVRREVLAILNGIEFQGMYFRTDLGDGLNRELFSLMSDLHSEG